MECFVEKVEGEAVLGADEKVETGFVFGGGGGGGDGEGVGLVGVEAGEGGNGDEDVVCGLPAFEDRIAE